MMVLQSSTGSDWKCRSQASEAKKLYEGKALAAIVVPL